MKNKICFYVFGFPPDFSGATMQTLYLADFLKRKGLECFFLTYTYDSEKLNVKEHSGYKVVRFLRQKTYNLFFYHCKLLFSFFKQRSEYSIIYINGNDGQFWTILWSVLFSKIFSKRLFVELNMDIPHIDPLGIKGTSLEKIKLYFMDGVEKFISNSTASTKNFIKSYPKADNIETVFYGIDTKRFKKEKDHERKELIRKKLNLPLNAMIAMTCGCVSKRKGIDFLLDCWTEISQRYEQESLLVIVGPFDKVQEGYDKKFIEEILQRLKELPLKGKVLLTGQVDNVDEYMKATDMFLFASRQEGSPSVIREAMSSSLPIVSLNLPDITSDLIENNKSGFVIELEDYKNLSNFQNEPINDTKAKEHFINGALKIMDAPSLGEKLGENAREKIEKEYSFEIKTEKYINLFNLKK